MKYPDILLVDDDPGTIQLLARILSGVGRLRFATNGETALRLAREAPPDLMLLDAEMPGLSGFTVCQAMKADPALAEVAVIFVTSHSETAIEVNGLELGAADFIAKPVSEPLVMARVKTQLRVKYLTDELRRIATIDALTEVPNRRCFDDVFHREWLRARRSGYPLALLMVDVDHFKRYNDAYGHPSGDGCLRSVAQALASTCLRPADLVARVGGEEFALLLPQTQRAGAWHLAQRVIDSVAALGIPHVASQTATSVSVSVGVSAYDESSACWTPMPSGGAGHEERTALRSADDLVKAADQALYAAKQAGRAQAWWLDIADVGQAGLERAIDLNMLAARPRSAG